MTDLAEFEFSVYTRPLFECRSCHEEVFTAHLVLSSRGTRVPICTPCFEIQEGAAPRG